jgi:hypothetical protein
MGGRAGFDAATGASDEHGFADEQCLEDGKAISMTNS